MAQTGVQILFAFLLNWRSTIRSPRDRAEFTFPLAAALVASTCSALCFMASGAVHRFTFRLGGKERLVWVTHRLALTGLTLLALR